MSSMFIDGQWVAAASGETIPVMSPVTGEAFEAIARGRAVDVDTRCARRSARLPAPGAG